MSGGRQQTLLQVWGAPGGRAELGSAGHDSDDDLLLAAAAAADPCPVQGFSEAAGAIWIYPTNLPVRPYQERMAGAALLANTLVCLPTGLGKTFVAAVVMYNFYRWFPSGKVLFLAPTKPLVAQQMEACGRVMGIPSRDMAEMTGGTQALDRRELWNTKRVFFLTPQIMVNDLSRGTCPAVEIKCLVIDEAHKALGNHAYCQVVRELSKYTNQFRVLALSATPGSDTKAVQQVISNLLIAQIEMCTEDSPEIQPYSHERQVEKIVVPLGEELVEIQNTYIKVLEAFAGRLIKVGVLSRRDIPSLTKYQIILARDQYRKNPSAQHAGIHQGIIEGDFALCISLYHGYELLLQMGLRSLFSFLWGIMDGPKGLSRTKNELGRNEDFMKLYLQLQGMFSASACNSTTALGKKKEFVYSHPKLKKLEEIVVEHFKSWKQRCSAGEEQGGSPAGDTRVMIFSSFRDSVQEVAELLARLRPAVRAMTFVGHSSGRASKGFSQREQLEVVRRFREGGYNTLVSTCVGEEGLDIGEVDLIVCLDAQRSPVRLVQRMGRTGRRRRGRIVLILAQGREERNYNQSQCNKRSINKAISGNKTLRFYQHSPRMVPEGINPKVHKMFISAEKEEPRMFSKGRRCSSLQHKSALPACGPGQKQMNSHERWSLSPEEFEIWDRLYRIKESDGIKEPVLPRGRFETLENLEGTPFALQGPGEGPRELSLCEWSLWQSQPLPTSLVEHSDRCHLFIGAMQMMELMRHQQGDCSYEQELLPHLHMEDVNIPGSRRHLSTSNTPWKHRARCCRTDLAKSKPKPFPADWGDNGSEFFSTFKVTKPKAARRAPGLGEEVPVLPQDPPASPSAARLAVAGHSELGSDKEEGLEVTFDLNAFIDLCDSSDSPASPASPAAQESSPAGESWGRIRGDSGYETSPVASELFYLPQSCRDSFTLLAPPQEPPGLQQTFSQVQKLLSQSPPSEDELQGLESTMTDEGTRSPSPKVLPDGHSEALQDSISPASPKTDPSLLPLENPKVTVPREFSASRSPCLSKTLSSTKAAAAEEEQLWSDSFDGLFDSEEFPEIPNKAPSMTHPLTKGPSKEPFVPKDIGEALEVPGEEQSLHLFEDEAGEDMGEGRTGREAGRDLPCVSPCRDLPCVSPCRDLPRVSPCRDLSCVSPCRDLPCVSPCRDLPCVSPCRNLPRVSPCRDLSCVSPCRDLPCVSPCRDLSCVSPCRNLPRVSPCRDLPRVSPCRDLPRVSPCRNLPRVSPCRDLPRVSPCRDLPRVSPCRDLPRVSPCRNLPRVSPCRDLPRVSPCRDLPRVSPCRDLPCVSPCRDLPRVSPCRDLPRVSPCRDLPCVSPCRDLSCVSPCRDLPCVSPCRDLPRVSPCRDLPCVSPCRDLPRVSPCRDLPRVSPCRDLPRVSPCRDLPRVSPCRDLPRVSPCRDLPCVSPRQPCREQPWGREPMGTPGGDDPYNCSQELFSVTFDLGFSIEASGDESSEESRSADHPTLNRAPGAESTEEAKISLGDGSRLETSPGWDCSRLERRAMSTPLSLQSREGTKGAPAAGPVLNSGASRMGREPPEPLPSALLTPTSRKGVNIKAVKRIPLKVFSSTREQIPKVPPVGEVRESPWGQNFGRSAMDSPAGRTESLRDTKAQGSPAAGPSSDSEEEIIFQRKNKIKKNVLKSPDGMDESDLESPARVPRKRRHPLSLSDSSSEGTGDFQRGRSSSRARARPLGGAKRQRLRDSHTAKAAGRQFLDEEAELSQLEAEGISSDESDGAGEELSPSLAQFLDDEEEPTQALNDSEMRAVYLSSVRSPALGSRYRLVQRPFNPAAIFSQIPEQDSAYAEDSFCVGDEEEEAQSGCSEEELGLDFALLPEGSSSSRGRCRYLTRRRRRLEQAGLAGAGPAPGHRRKPSRIVVLSDSSEEETAASRERPLAAGQGRGQLPKALPSAPPAQPSSRAGAGTAPQHTQRLLGLGAAGSGMLDLPQEHPGRSTSIPTAGSGCRNTDLQAAAEVCTSLKTHGSSSGSVCPAVPNPSSAPAGISRVPGDHSPSLAGISRVPGEQSPSLAGISRVPGDHSPSLAGISRVPGDHSPSLAGISRVPGDHSPSLAGISRVPGDHSPSLAGISRVPGDQSPSLAGISRVPGDQSPSLAGISRVPGEQSPSLAGISRVPGDHSPSLAGISRVPGDHSPSLCILADSREISSGPEVLSSLRAVHGLRVQVCSLGSSDYIVSSRLAVDRLLQSELQSAANRSKLSQRLQRLQGAFERICVIVETDRVRPGETSRVFQRTQYYDGVLSALVQAGIKILFSSCQQESAALLKELALLEHRKDAAIQVPTEPEGHQRDILSFYLSIPNLSYSTALHLCHSFSSITAMANSSLPALAAGARLSRSQAEELQRFLRHDFDLQLLPQAKS